MIFHIEGNSKWAEKLNTSIMKCHDKFENNDRYNYESCSEDGKDDVDIQMIQEEFK